LEDGLTISVVKEIARERKCYFFAGSWVERSEDGLHNTAVFITPEGETLATYRKMHLFGYQSKEQELMIAGDRPVVVETPLGRFGLGTCYDLRFPELFRALLDMGAECFLITSGWPFPRLEHWKLLNRSRAVENLCFLISCNSCDKQDDVHFCGHSMVVDPWGDIMGTLDEKEAVLAVNLDLKRVTTIRSEFPALQDRVLGNA
jgi:predicted amidohydrolase